MRRSLLLLVLAVLATSACKRDVAAPKSNAGPRVDVSLDVLVVGQPEIAKEIGRLRGDWVDVSGGDLRVLEATDKEFSADDPLAADVVLYPARFLAQLIEAERLRPLRQSVIEEESLAFGEILPVVREGELRYGGEYYAVPFGSRVLAITQGTGSAGELANRAYGAAWTLLARAAPLAVHPNQVAVLFDLDTMDARIAGPPFVRALEEWTGTDEEANAAGGPHVTDWSFWPPRASPSSRNAGGETPPVALPKSEAIYDWDAEAWEAPTDGLSRVPLVGAASYIGSVTSASRDAPAAFRLLAWLAAKPGSGAAAVSIVPFRRGGTDQMTESALSARNYLHVPRILQIDAYLAALDENVRRAMAGELGPQDALQAAADEWNAITDHVGRDRQRAAYRKHLNLQ